MTESEAKSRESRYVLNMDWTDQGIVLTGRPHGDVGGTDIAHPANTAPAFALRAYRV